jgi:hypothetical protein
MLVNTLSLRLSVYGWLIMLISSLIYRLEWRQKHIIDDLKFTFDQIRSDRHNDVNGVCLWPSLLRLHRARESFNRNEAPLLSSWSCLFSAFHINMLIYTWVELTSTFSGDDDCVCDRNRLSIDEDSWNSGNRYRVLEWNYKIFRAVEYLIER